MNCIPSNAVLLIIDVQKGFDDTSHWGKRNNPQAEDNIARILGMWRQVGKPVVHIKHNSIEKNSPLRPGQAGNEFRDSVMPQPGEHVEEKTVNSAFIGTGLEKYLRANGYDTLVIVGLTTDHCVSTSTRMAGNLGFNAYLVADATATFDKTGFDGKLYPAEELHACNLASLNEEFAIVITTEILLEELQRSGVSASFI